MDKEGFVTPNQTRELTNLLGQLCMIIEQLEDRLRVYESALRFAKTSHPIEAAILERCLVIAETGPIVQDAASKEHAATVQKAHALVSKLIEELDSPNKTEAEG
jgi:hypothetical protein